MKTSLLYGAMMAIASAVLTLVLFFLGLHSDPEKIPTAQLVATVSLIVINVTGIVLGIRARRAECPLDRPFGYGQALLAGLLVGVFAGIFASVFQVMYTTLINPAFIDVLVQQQSAKLEATGMPSEQVEKALGMMRFIFKPAVQFVIGLLSWAFWAFVISLIAAAFLKRSDSPAAAPPLPATPV